MAEQKRRLVPEDLYEFVTVSEPQISPDGEVVAFVRGHIDKESKEVRSQVWLVPAAGGKPVPFTRGPKSDSSPRWSPDGRTLAFVSDRGGDRQIWLIDRYGGEARQLTFMRHGAGGPVWSPDGKYIAFGSSVGPEDKRELLTRTKGDADKKAEEKKAKDEARTFTAMRWRDNAIGIRPDRKAQIWVVAVPEAGDPTPAPVQVTWGSYDHAGPEWSPCGQYLAFGANRTEDESFKVRDIFITPLPGTDSAAARASVAPPAPGAEPPAEEEAKALADSLKRAAEEAEAAFQPRNITGGIGAFEGAYFSPDGQTIAAIGHQNEFQNATLPKIYLYPAAGGEPRILDHHELEIGNSVGADVRPGGGGVSITWSPGGQWIYVPVVERGACSVYAFPISGDKPQLLVGGKREIADGSFDRRGQKLAFAAGSIFAISDIYVFDVVSGEEKQLTAVNKELFDQIEWPELEELNFKARDGWDLHGWLLKPVGFEPGKQYPLVLDIHGGPHTCFGYAFYQEMQLLAAEGYGVLFINPRGSTSYGQAFVDAVRGDYGNRDYKDLMDAVDHLLTLGWVDEKRLAVTGGSYGGFMTNWIVTQTDRFAAAITHRSISNWVSFSGTPDFGPFFNQIQHKVDDPWSPEGVQELWRISPLAYVKNVKTPISIMHSEYDYRCPIEQAEQFYMGIKFYSQAPTELVRHPRSNHDMTRQGPPALRVDRFHKMLRWFGKYCPAN